MGPDFEIDEGYSVAKPVSFSRPWQMSLQRLTKLGFALVGIYGLIVLLGPRSSCCNGERMRQAQCINNLKQIQLALEAYHERYGQLPPAYVADAMGQPMYGWRVLILPLLDESDLYNQFDLGEPWNGPHNIKLLGKMPYFFACPSQAPFSRDQTNYVTITGPGTMFPGTASVKFADVTDGASNTVMVAETANVGVPWTAPLDLEMGTMSFRINDPNNPGISSKHPGGANVACGGGGPHFFKDTLPAKRLRSLITINAADWNPDDDGSRSY